MVARKISRTATLFKKLQEIFTRLSAIEKALSSLTSEAATTSAPDTDGPLPPNEFRLKGKSCRLAALEWRLVRCLWRKPAVPLDEVLDFVYGHDQDDKDDALRSVGKRLKRRLHKKEIPVEVISTNGYMALRLRGREGVVTDSCSTR